MGLMHPRVALNFIRNGYYPTGEATLEALLTGLEAPEDGQVRIYDPCCGEGVALAEVKHWLGADRTEAYGIEVDRERAWHAKRLLDRAIHADYQRCKTDRNGFGLLYLNPPYGRMMSDQARTGLVDEEKRLEHLFLRLSTPHLQYGGVLVLIVPWTCMDETMEHLIFSNYEDVRIFRAIEDQFKQLVIFGRRKRRSYAKGPFVPRDEDGAMVIDDDTAPVIENDLVIGEPYVVPSVNGPLQEFITFEVDEEQLREETLRHGCLWDDFDVVFTRTSLPPRRPLYQPSDWHLSLSLAAGQLAGLVESDDGRRLLVKGDTFKYQEEKVEVLRGDGDEEDTTVTTRTDRFVPIIRAIDLTPHSEQFGTVYSIR